MRFSLCCMAVSMLCWALASCDQAGTKAPEGKAPEVATADLSEYERLAAVADKAEAAQKKSKEGLEKAWEAVQKVAGTKSIDFPTRAGLFRKFLQDFPTDNPHAVQAQAMLSRLEDGEEASWDYGKKLYLLQKAYYDLLTRPGDCQQIASEALKYLQDNADRIKALRTEIEMEKSNCLQERRPQLDKEMMRVMDEAGLLPAIGSVSSFKSRCPRQYAEADALLTKISSPSRL